ncbi:insulin-induced gene 2 protein-like [Halichondria panicea]|uniref:insulin-induced gene 2 protein-like n=1 Tax=Halichondria panicea TaxID=6063 RepID=UPI00312B86B9
MQSGGMDSKVASRGITLFTLGLALAIALNQLWSLVLPAWLLFPLLAGAVTITGLLYPYVSGEDAPDISEIMRCVAVSVGIFQASTKIDFSSYIELAVTMGALGVGMWWLFDRSKGGLLLSFVLTLLSTGITAVLLHLYNVKLSDPRFFYSRLWCIYFSGCITFGTIGRRLALSD